MKVGDTNWTFDVYTPESCHGKPSPVVIALHGRGGDSGFALGSGLVESAAKDSFIVIAPNGQHNRWQDLNGTPLQKIDIAFFSRLLDEISKFGGDPKRIYVCGFSNGGGMSFFLGAYFSERIAAVMGGGASVGAINESLEYCGLPDLKRPVPCLMEHGMQDKVNGYGMETFTMSQPDALAWWGRQIGAKGSPTHKEIGRGHVMVDRLEGRSDSDVILYSYKNAGHTWPSSEDAETGIVWNDVMWDFFKAHRLP